MRRRGREKRARGGGIPGGSLAFRTCLWVCFSPLRMHDPEFRDLRTLVPCLVGGVSCGGSHFRNMKSGFLATAPSIPFHSAGNGCAHNAPAAEPMGGNHLEVGLLYVYSDRTSRNPSSSAFITRDGNRPDRLDRKPLSTVMTRDTFATESLGRPESAASIRTLPGASARRRFEVRRTATTVRMRLRLNAFD